MAMNNKSALLLGATGLVGGHCREFLLASPRYSRVTVLVRRKLDAEHPKLTQHIIDFDRLAEHTDLLRVDDVFCCLGTTIRQAGSQEAFRKVDFAYPTEAAGLAAQQGARQFLLVSSLGADPGSRVFYNRTKGEVEAAISEIPFAGVHIFRPSLLRGNRAEFRLGERIGEMVMVPLALVMVGRWRKYRPIHARAVAFAMVKVAAEGRDGVNITESDGIQALWAQRTMEK